MPSGAQRQDGGGLRGEDAGRGEDYEIDAQPVIRTLHQLLEQPRGALAGLGPVPQAITVHRQHRHFGTRGEGDDDEHAQQQQQQQVRSGVVQVHLRDRASFPYNGLMFDSLTSRLSRTVDALRGRGRITEDNVAEVLREVRVALLEADVALPVIKQFIDQVKTQALGTEVASSLTPARCSSASFTRSWWR